MPSTVNGIGTWYYGKNNLVTRNDRCEFCGGNEQLKSYDTTLYFVVVFIPVIPLGRRRIIDQCPRCRRHRAAKLGEWEKRKVEAILQATEAWQQDRANSSKAIAALGTPIGFHDVESFRQLAGPIGNAFARDAEVQVFLGDAYDHFGDLEPAEQAYRAALMSRPDEQSQEALAKFFLRRNRAAEAEPLLAHIVANRVRPKAMLAMAVAEAHQGVGDHERAWRIVDEVGTAFPDLLSDPHYEKIRRSVSRNRGTNRIVRSADVKRDDGVKQTNWLHRHMGLAIVSSIIVCAAMWYLILAWSLGKHTVSLLNGTNAIYVVDINGQSFRIPPMSRVPADIREGTLRVRVTEGCDNIPPQTIEMHTDFFRRPWNRRTMIINPDRAALVVWEQTEYAASSTGLTPDPPRKVYLGKPFYDLDKVDYVFEKFPSKLKLQDEDKKLIRTRVGMAQDEIGVVSALSVHLPAEQQIEFLRQHQSDRPLRLQFHRLYQGLVEVNHPEYDLHGEYLALVEKDPTNSTLTYLLGRVTDDRDQAAALFRKAADDPASPSAYASYALSFDALNIPQFDEALARAKQALKSEPNNAMFLEMQIDALEGMGRIDEAIEVVKAAETHDARDGAKMAIEVRLMAAKHDLDSARKRIDAFCKDLATALGNVPQIETDVKIPLQGVMHYAAGDMPAYRAAVSAQDGPDATFAGSITEGKIDAAQTALAQMKPPTATEHFILYIAAMKAKQAQIAEAAWSRAVELMAKSHRDDRVFAALLTKSEPPGDKALRNWTAMPLERCIALTALGLRFPQQQATFFAAARKLNYSRRFPYHLIDQTLSAGRIVP